MKAFLTKPIIYILDTFLFFLIGGLFYFPVNSLFKSMSYYETLRIQKCFIIYSPEYCNIPHVFTFWVYSLLVFLLIKSNPIKFGLITWTAIIFELGDPYTIIYGFVTLGLVGMIEYIKLYAYYQGLKFLYKYSSDKFNGSIIGWLNGLANGYLEQELEQELEPELEPEPEHANQ